MNTIREVLSIYLLVTLCISGVSGCATVKSSSHAAANDDVSNSASSPSLHGSEAQTTIKRKRNPDPFEKFNRVMFKFNEKVDRYVAKPVAKGYRAITPRPLRKGISNFFHNLREPITILNDLLQGKLKQAGSDLGRFLVNSTLGFFGFLDLASEIGLPRHDEDFGQTLGKWGVRDGPYLVLPVFGPSNVRDAFGSLADNEADAVRQKDDSSTRSKLTVLRAVNTRANLLDATDILEQAGEEDPYLFVREFYRQRRRNLVYDGDPPDDEESDPFLFEEEALPSADAPPPAEAK